MATYNRFTSPTTSVAGVYPSPEGHRQPTMVSRTINFAAAGNTNAAGDDFPLISIPAGTLILATGVEVETAGTGTGTINVRLGTTTRGTATAPTTAGYVANLFSATGALAATATNLNLITATDVVNATVRLWALVVPADGDINDIVSTGAGTNTQLVSVTI